jgi:hypothetical protein
MTKKAFSTAESVAVYLAYDQVCALCEKPISELLSLTIDHLVPENYLEKSAEWKATRKKYGISEGYNINDFENWVAAHPKCNSRKGKLIKASVLAMTEILGIADRRGKIARKHFDKIRGIASLGRLAASLEEMIQQGKMSVRDFDQLREVLRELENAAPLDSTLLVGNAKWKFSEHERRGIAYVTDDERGGVTLTEDATAAMRKRWRCDYCGGFGPYQELEAAHMFCLTCGMENKLITNFQFADHE